MATGSPARLGPDVSGSRRPGAPQRRVRCGAGRSLSPSGARPEACPNRGPVVAGIPPAVSAAGPPSLAPRFYLRHLTASPNLTSHFYFLAVHGFVDLPYFHCGVVLFFRLPVD